MIVSVIMSIYSEKVEWIKDSIDSILNQTFKDFEFIIINDNPGRKENVQLLSQYKNFDNRILIITNNENIGLTKSLNKGLEIAQGKYIARMDADDVSLPERFCKQVEFLDNNKDYVACGGNILYFGQNKKKVTYPEDSDSMFLFLRSPFAHPVVMFRNRLKEDNGENIRYNENIKYAQDYDLWFRMSRIGKFYNLQSVLLKYRITNGQISSKKLTEQQNFAGKTRRKAFNYFCSANNIDYNIADVIDLKELMRFQQIVLNENKWSTKEEKALVKFKYYLYRSINKGNIAGLFYLFYSLDIFKFSLSDSLKTTVFLLTKKLPKLI